MGTLPSARRAGVGRALLRLCLEHVRGAGATRLWCNARTSARAFCAAQGLHARGDEFQMPDLGPHIVMVVELLSWELRAVTEADREFLRDLHRATLRDYVDQVWGWDDAQQREMFDARWDPAPRRIIRLDGRDVGTLTVETKRDEVFLADIGILPEFQSRGLGSSVIRRVLADADASGLPVRLQVLRPNPARRLYERLGFVVTEESPERYTMLRS